MMWEAAARKIRERGGTVLMGRELQQLAYDARPQALARRRGDRRRPERDLHGAPRHQLGADARTGREALAARRSRCLHARALRYRDFLTVALMVKKPDLFPDNWIYIHDRR